MLPSLAARMVVSRRVALVVAHPDDETLAAGASLRLMPELLLVHVTDGSPRLLDDGRRLGFATPEAYAQAREQEVRAALQLAGLSPWRVSLGVADQDASLAMAAIVGRLSRAFAEHGTEVVLTHAYEGGHPDHDATALCVHVAAHRMGLPVIEFAGYHLGPLGGGGPGEMTLQRFLPGPAETHVKLDPAEALAKRAMLDCFRTQATVLAPFGVSVERFRPAPGYDFTAPPHDGPLNYETWGWPMTGARWRSLAGEMLTFNV